MLSDTQLCYESIMWGRCLAWYDASLGRWRSLVRIRPTPYFCVFPDVYLQICEKLDMNLTILLLNDNKIDNPLKS